MMILIVVLLLLFFFGGGYWGRNNERVGFYGGAGIGLGGILVILLILYLLGFFRHL